MFFGVSFKRLENYIRMTNPNFKNNYNKENTMETWYYEVVSIDGDYANLKRTDIELDDVKLVARALLPAEIVVGSQLKYELLQYELIG